MRNPILGEILSESYESYEGVRESYEKGDPSAINPNLPPRSINPNRTLLCI